MWYSWSAAPRELVWEACPPRWVQYIQDLDASSLHIGVFSGDVVLRDLKLRPDALDPLPRRPCVVPALSVSPRVERDFRKPFPETPGVGCSALSLFFQGDDY